MLKPARNRKNRRRHHALPRILQFPGPPARPREACASRTGLTSIWTPHFAAGPLFGIHASDFDPK
jgi:hypothetical protein